MKIAVIILSVLIAENMVCGISEDMRRFTEYYKECLKMLDGSNEFRIDALLCASIKDGEILLSNGEYSRESVLRKFPEFISDPAKLKQAYEIFFRCDNEVVVSGAVGVGKAIRWMICGMPVVNLFDSFTISNSKK